METARLPALPAAADLLAGRYALGEVIGIGGFALVYRAEDRLTRRTVAVKVYPPDPGEPHRARQRSELELLTRLRHPNLVDLLAAGQDSGHAYLVMALIDGPTLAQRLADGPMPAAEVAGIGASLADALDYVHRSGVVHRDVKPANVLLGERAMLTDFGIARLIGSVGATQSGLVIGTPAYLAPEQLGEAEVGPPADVYALGLVLLEALTGRREYDGAASEVAFARLARQPQIPPGLPGLSGTLRAMTDLEPGRRPTASQVADYLRRSAPGLAALPALAPPAARISGTGPLPLLAPGTGTRRRQLLAASLAVLAAAGLAVALHPTTQQTQEPAASVPATMQPAVAPQPPPAPAQVEPVNGDGRSERFQQDRSAGRSDKRSARKRKHGGAADGNSSSGSGGGSTSGSSGDSSGGGSSDGSSSDQGG